MAAKFNGVEHIFCTRMSPRYLSKRIETNFKFLCKCCTLIVKTTNRKGFISGISLLVKRPGLFPEFRIGLSLQKGTQPMPQFREIVIPLSARFRLSAREEVMFLRTRDT